LTRRYAEPDGVRGLASHNWSLNFKTCLLLGLAGAEGSQVRAEAGRLAPGVAEVQGAARTIAVLSPNYLESVYAGAEWQAAWAQDPDGKGRKLLVISCRVSESIPPYAGAFD
jgi:type IV secretory pathway TrbF-like protein